MNDHVDTELYCVCFKVDDIVSKYYVGKNILLPFAITVKKVIIKYNGINKSILIKQDKEKENNFEKRTAV